MHEQEVQIILARNNAVIIDSHFVYTSGKHGSAYINKDAIYTNPIDTSKLCLALAEKFERDAVEVVVAPAVGAIILSQWVAYHLSYLTDLRVAAVYADKMGADDFVIKRGYERLIPGKRVLVVEDLFTTGGSAKKVVDTVRALKGEVVGVAGLANRGAVTAEHIGTPTLVSLLSVTMEQHDAATCPLCINRVPINTNLGHGAQFIAAQSTAK